jgi:hypothetical protein
MQKDEPSEAKDHESKPVIQVDSQKEPPTCKFSTLVSIGFIVLVMAVLVGVSSEAVGIRGGGGPSKTNNNKTFFVETVLEKAYTPHLLCAPQGGPSPSCASFVASQLMKPLLRTDCIKPLTIHLFGKVFIALDL